MKEKCCAHLRYGYGVGCPSFRFDGRVFDGVCERLGVNEKIKQNLSPLGNPFAAVKTSGYPLREVRALTLVGAQAFRHGVSRESLHLGSNFVKRKLHRPKQRQQQRQTVTPPPPPIHTVAQRNHNSIDDAITPNSSPTVAFNTRPVHFE